jgi:alkylmercury lyase
METMRYATELAARLFPADGHGGSRELLVALLRELARGHPVRQESLAATLGCSAGRVAAILASEPSTEYDGDGSVIGYGITLRETAHAFEVSGQRLYTWCALDALMFPILIGKTARVLSHCPATRLPVSLTVSPGGVRDVEPASAVLSLPPLQTARDIRSSFCCHVHFYASASAADRSISATPGTELLSIEDAFCLGRVIAGLLATGTGAAEQPDTIEVEASRSKPSMC